MQPNKYQIEIESRWAKTLLVLCSFAVAIPIISLEPYLGKNISEFGAAGFALFLIYYTEKYAKAWIEITVNENAIIHIECIAFTFLSYRSGEIFPISDVGKYVSKPYYSRGGSGTIFKIYLEDGTILKYRHLDPSTDDFDRFDKDFAVLLNTN